MKNITENKKDGTFTVRTPNGKTQVFKTRRGAENHAANHARRYQIPMVCTANTYFWTPNSSASGRRSNEKRRNAEIEDFANAVASIPTVRVSGSYSESCRNVYKSMTYSVERDGTMVNTNLTGLIGECARWGLELVK